MIDLPALKKNSLEHKLQAARAIVQALSATRGDTPLTLEATYPTHILLRNCRDEVIRLEVQFGSEPRVLREEVLGVMEREVRQTIDELIAANRPLQAVDIADLLNDRMRIYETALASMTYRLSCEADGAPAQPGRYNPQHASLKDLHAYVKRLVEADYKHADLSSLTDILGVLATEEQRVGIRGREIPANIYKNAMTSVQAIQALFGG